MNTVKGRVAIVTGGGQGMGRETALLLGKEGAKVVVCDIAKSKEQPDKYCADLVAEQIRAEGGEAIACNADLSIFETGKKLVDEAVKAYGTIDIVCMVAGAQKVQPVDELDEATWNKLMAINCTTMFSLVHYAAPIMKEKGYGRIVCYASRAAFGNGKSAIYSASKGGVMGFAAELGYELTPFGIHTNCILPSAVTGLFPNSKVAYDGTPKPDPEGPDMVAPMTVYLCSEACEQSGEFFYVSGCDVGLYPRNRLPVGLIRKGNKEKWTVEELSTMVPETFDWYFATKQKTSTR
ncbi:MAG: SDR family NAD(P)-dependent oxidoreductase [Lachnospiraceae bacterium]|nr:SDR family NAD(P)-dependent oxidoreductase [Lachnospiraceae bacterium]